MENLTNFFLYSILISLPFFVALWLMIFLNVYRHFPKMEPSKRIKLSIENATYPTLILSGIIYLALWFILRNFIA